MQPPPEHLGSFYLGAEYDLQTGKHTNIPLNYDARDLTTHALCIGMTGSGKTGLCLGLLEEAAIDDVPAILIDPKGDISNLVLQFPALKPEDFIPWISEEDAQREGKSATEYAADTAQRWKDGLEAWGIGQDRIRLLKESADYSLYTPGSDAGVPVNILGSLAAPGLSFDDHAEIIRERINGTVNALLGFIGIAADPVQSRETILLSTIFEHFWRQNQDLDLTKLILSLQNPPVQQLGVLDVDTFYPEKERFQLAMAFNNLVAAPKFRNWLQGEALDIDSLLFTNEGKPRHSIFYISHLSDQERMFFVTLLLESILAWVRSQTGTQSLRAMLYFDEVYGFLPPVAQPSSKRPLMALLKQGRAVGLGCVLATQNPADVDYKGLTNTGTWFIGRLQTERDKARVMEGLESAIVESRGHSPSVDYDRVIGQLRPRVFLMHNVHDERPVVFQTRWVMSYLHGPLTRSQIKTLTADRKHEEHVSSETITRPTIAAEPGSSATVIAPPSGYSSDPQVLDPNVPQFFLPVTEDEITLVTQHVPQIGYGQTMIEEAQLVYEPAILGGASVRFFDRKHGISEQRELVLLAPPPDPLGSVDWNQAQDLPLSLRDLGRKPTQVTPDQGPFFAPVPEAANSAAELKGIVQAFADWVYYNSQLSLLAHPGLGVVQRPEETERSFKLRLRQAAREQRDANVENLRTRYAAKMEKLEAKLRKQQRNLEQEESDYEARKREALIATGEMLFTVLTRRRLYRTASWTASRRRLAKKAEMEIEEGRQEIEELEVDLSELQNELEREITRITPKWVDILKALTAYTVQPRRSDVDVRLVGLAWTPFWIITYASADQSATTTLPAYPTEIRPISQANP